MFLNRQNNLKFASSLLGAFDILATITSLLLSSTLIEKLGFGHVVFNVETILIAGVFVLSWIILLKVTHLARIPRTMSYSIIFYDFLRLSVLAGLILLGLNLIIRSNGFPAITVITFVITNAVVLFLLRLITFKIFKIYRATGHNLRNVIILAEEGGDDLIDKIYSRKEWGFRVLCVITDSASLRQKFHGKIKLYPSAINIKSIVQYDIVDEIICLGCTGSDKIYSLIDFCNELGVTVRLKSVKALNLASHYKKRIQYFGKVPFYTIENNPNNRIEHIVKYLFEFIIAFGVLFLLSPFLILITLLIAATSRGPVIFKQARVGLRGRQFYIYKFRTMVQNAEELKAKLEAMNESDGPTFKIKNDPRITGIGRFLRKTNLDEVPQLFNVLKGEMSIIGPRPPLPKEVEQYERWHLKRLAVKPGLTCTWQIVPNRNEVKFDSWMKMDIQYIENWSLKNDFELFIKTFQTVISAKSY